MFIHEDKLEERLSAVVLVLIAIGFTAALHALC